MTINKRALTCLLWAAICSTGLGQDPIKTSGVRGGLVVQLGCGDGQATAKLRVNNSYVVQGLDIDPKKITAARANLLKTGDYGRVTAALYDGKTLPYIDNTVNLIVADANTSVPMQEIMRALAPRGVALIGGKKTVKPVPDSLSDWTHYLYSAGNNAVSTDTEVGPPAGFQWIGGPKWGRHHEHMSSISAMVSAQGRVFYIVDEGSRASIQLPAKWKLIARDAFNGTILWKRDIPTWYTHLYPLKSGPAILPRRLIAIEDRVYVALGIDQPLVELDAITGKTLHTYAETAKAEEVIYSNDALFVVSDRTPHKKDTFVWTDPVCWTVGNTASNARQWGGTVRSIFAIKPKTGKVLWAKETNIGPSTLSADDKHIIYFNGREVVCLDRNTGEKKWFSENKPKKKNNKKGGRAPSGLRTFPSYTLPILVVHKDVVLLSPQRTILAFSLETGKQLWEKPQLTGGHRSADDLMCVDDLVWTADVARSNRMVAYDLHTGEEKRSFACDAEGYWFHHRCHRSKATTRYFMPSRTGIEYVDWDSEHWKRNHWVRGACILGVIPANGLTYAPQHACACYMETKLTGLNALTASTASQSQLSTPEEQRLERGPAFSKTPLVASKTATTDWPTFRSDNGRSGHIKAAVGKTIRSAWTTSLGGKLSAITAADGKMYISAIDQQTVYALNQQDGKVAWNFVAGGRVDSPPTLFKGRVYFGCNDGYVYCLRSSDGALVWRYLAARGRAKHVAFEQVESLWPVNGAVLIRDGVIYCVAGRSAFLDGGMRLCRIDAATGNLVSETILDNKVPGTQEALDDRMKGLNLPPGLPDVLSCDEKHVYMRSQEFTFEGVRTNIMADSDPTLQFGDNRHLFCSIGYLDDSWFHRSYWMYGGTVTSGCNYWFYAGRYAPSGRIMCFDEEDIYSFGRLPKYYVWTPALEYRLYKAKKAVTPEMIARVKAGIGTLSKKSSRWIFDRFVSGSLSVKDGSVSEVQWSQDMPKMQTRAMALAGGTLFVAGPPDLLDEEKAVKQHWTPEMEKAIAEQDAALLGKRGASLWVVSTTDGERTDEIELDSPPVWDGMAATKGKLFMATMDGKVHCFQGR